jgi:hypothetical protein
MLSEPVPSDRESASQTATTDLLPTFSSMLAKATMLQEDMLKASQSDPHFKKRDSHEQGCHGWRVRILGAGPALSSVAKKFRFKKSS